MEKKEIRKKALDQRNAIPEVDRIRKSLRISETVRNLKWYDLAEALLIYRNFRTEVDTSQLIEKAWEKEKKVFCPRVNGKDMEFYLVESWNDFEPGSYGIEEPKKNCTVFSGQYEHVLAILPGAAFDKNRHRIGYGGGFYDRYLAGHPNILTVAICFEEQIMEKVPSELFDICPQKIITDQACYE